MGTGEVGCHGQNEKWAAEEYLTSLPTLSPFCSLTPSFSLLSLCHFPPSLSFSVPPSLFLPLSFPLSLLSSSFSSLSFTLSSLSFSLSSLSVSLAQMSFKQTFLKQGPP